jgi:hypothetical protein
MAKDKRDWKALYREFRDKGICSSCRRNKCYPGISKCEACWFKLAARRNLGNQDHWQRLRDALLEQQGKCAYTGRSLTIGANASLEHIEPVSRSTNRATDVKNIKWVATEVNMAKGSRTLSEFLSMCKEVLTHFGYEVKKDGSSQA